MSEEFVIKKAVNTGYIAYLKFKGYSYTTECSLDQKSNKMMVNYYFKVPKNEEQIAGMYWNSDFMVFKRELDTIRQEMESIKGNWSKNA